MSGAFTTEISVSFLKLAIDVMWHVSVCFEYPHFSQEFLLSFLVIALALVLIRANAEDL